MTFYLNELPGEKHGIYAMHLDRGGVRRQVGARYKHTGEKVKKLLVTFVLISVSAMGQGLNCNDPHTGELCKALERVEESFNWTCTGSACYGLWRRQMSAMDEVSHCYEEHVPYGAR